MKKLNEDNLHKYQKRAIEFINTKKRCALFLDMGLGKSVTALTAASNALDSFDVNKVLIIAPLRVANTVWKQESRRWEHLSHLNFSIVTGPRENRIKELNKESDVYVMNQENTQWLVEHYIETKRPFPFDFIIIDESSSFKNPSSKRFKSLKKILKFTKYMVLLTGTPSPNGYLDLWSQMFLIDQGKSLGTTFTKYKELYFSPDYFGYNFDIKDFAISKIETLMKPHVISLQAKDYLELPNKINLIEYVDLPAKILKQYKSFKKTLVAELDNNQITAINSAALVNKLLQMSNGFMYDEEKTAYEIHSMKLDALDEIIQSNPNENILVAYSYKMDLARLQARFPEAVKLDGLKQVEDWNNNKIKLLLANPASAAMGLNLQHGGSIIVWFGLTWSLELYQQFNARLHRQGQTKPVRVIHIISKGTVDEEVLSALDSKDLSQSRLLSVLAA